MSDANAVETKPEPMKVALARFKPSVAPMVQKGGDVDRLFSMGLMQINADDKLRQCTIASIATALGRIATWGLEPGLTAHLVPYFSTKKNVFECTAIADYKGYVQLMRQCGARDVDAQVVRAGDVFTYEFGSHAELRHVPGHTRGAITHAYALVRLSHNVCKFEVMEYAEIDSLRKRYGTPNNKNLPGSPEWYCRKTVLRRVQKYVPQSGDMGLRLARARQDEMDDAEITPIEGDVQPIGLLPTRAPVSKLAVPDEYGEGEAVTERTITSPPPITVDWAEAGEAYDPDR